MTVAPGVRVSAGTLKGRRLEVPPGIRPSEGKVKEALFSIWSHELEGAEMLDLFAGSGAVGIEAVSRGALTVTFVERERRSLGLLRRNLSLLPPGAAVVRSGAAAVVLDALAAEARRFDLIFADPPYAQVPDVELLRRCDRVLRNGGKLAVEHSSRTLLPVEGAELVRIGTRRYGEAALTFYGKP